MTILKDDFNCYTKKSYVYIEDQTKRESVKLKSHTGLTKFHI